MKAQKYHYILKQINRYLLKSKHQALIPQALDHRTRTILCIPCYNEKAHDILNTLKSLLATEGDQIIEVLVLFNYSIFDAQELIAASDDSFAEVLAFAQCNTNDRIQIHVLKKVFDHKKSAGVGLARKTMMDEAAMRFASIGTNGLIVNLDADCVVSPNYFQEIEKHFDDHPEIEAAGLHFEHDLEMTLDENQKQAILQYELHLRYFINMQKYLGLPFAFQTIGSAMVVRADAYAKEGGMNKRKAGEDFYFLHKYIVKNKFNIIGDAIVYPQGRSSDRVPFGTGKAVSDHLKADTIERLTYNYQSFEALTSLILNIDQLYIYTNEEMDAFVDALDSNIKKYLIETDFISAIHEIRTNVSDIASFRKRFYRWFDAFRLMKYLHFVRDEGLGDIPISEALDYLFERLQLDKCKTLEETLISLRRYDQVNV